MLTFFNKSLLAVCRLDEKFSVYYDYVLRLLGFPDLLGFQISNSANLVSEAATRPLPHQNEKKSR